MRSRFRCSSSPVVREQAESSIAAIHHQVKDIEAQCRIFAEVTCSAKILKHPERAAEEIHELVGAIWTESRPGYLEIHRDLVELSIPVPKHLIEWNGQFSGAPGRTPGNSRKRSPMLPSASAPRRSRF